MAAVRRVQSKLELGKKDDAATWTWLAKCRNAKAPDGDPRFVGSLKV